MGEFKEPQKRSFLPYYVAAVVVSLAYLSIHFLKEKEDHITLHKLRRNKPITGQDIEELERINTCLTCGAKIRDYNKASSSYYERWKGSQ